MTATSGYSLLPIGVVRSQLKAREEAPMQGFEGAPEAWVEIAPVFATRSPDRPNPIGLHRAQVLEAEAPARLRVCPLEAVDGTSVVDIKPALPSLVVFARPTPRR